LLCPDWKERWVFYDSVIRIAESLVAELEREGKSTERILDRVPQDRLEWRPHPKSMSLGELAWHIAILPANAVKGLREGKREVGTSRPGPREGTEFVATFRRNLDELKAVLLSTPDEVLLTERFAFVRNSEPVVSFPKLGFIRTVMMNHSIHHRGQLTVYLRLLDVPVPAMYGTSADESAFDVGPASAGRR
jgi:uncharacterized damage-inducible protein DinB